MGDKAVTSSPSEVDLPSLASSRSNSIDVDPTTDTCDPAVKDGENIPAVTRPSSADMKRVSRSPFKCQSPERATPQPEEPCSSPTFEGNVTPDSARSQEAGPSTFGILTSKKEGVTPDKEGSEEPISSTTDILILTSEESDSTERESSQEPGTSTSCQPSTSKASYTTDRDSSQEPGPSTSCQPSTSKAPDSPERASSQEPCTSSSYVAPVKSVKFALPSSDESSSREESPHGGASSESEEPQPSTSMSEYSKRMRRILAPVKRGEHCCDFHVEKLVEMRHINVSLESVLKIKRPVFPNFTSAKGPFFHDREYLQGEEDMMTLLDNLNIDSLDRMAVIFYTLWQNLPRRKGADLYKIIDLFILYACRPCSQVARAIAVFIAEINRLDEDEIKEAKRASNSQYTFMKYVKARVDYQFMNLYITVGSNDVVSSMDQEEVFAYCCVTDSICGLISYLHDEHFYSSDEVEDMISKLFDHIYPQERPGRRTQILLTDEKTVNYIVLAAARLITMTYNGLHARLVTTFEKHIKNSLVRRLPEPLKEALGQLLQYTMDLREMKRAMDNRNLMFEYADTEEVRQFGLWIEKCVDQEGIETYVPLILEAYRDRLGECRYIVIDLVCRSVASRNRMQLRYLARLLLMVLRQERFYHRLDFRVFLIERFEYYLVQSLSMIIACDSISVHSLWRNSMLTARRYVVFMSELRLALVFEDTEFNMCFRVLMQRVDHGPNPSMHRQRWLISYLERCGHRMVKTLARDIVSYLSTFRDFYSIRTKSRIRRLQDLMKKTEDWSPMDRDDESDEEQLYDNETISSEPSNSTQTN